MLVAILESVASLLPKATLELRIELVALLRSVYWETDDMRDAVNTCLPEIRRDKRRRCGWNWK